MRRSVLLTTNALTFTSSTYKLNFRPGFRNPLALHRNVYSSSLISITVFFHWRAGMRRWNMMSISR